ncbi:MAG: NAD-dependent epimerase/dehydratase family protein [Planctomycetes bacterium]|nr:NAD-dependent epimerase/dehydratase family protein [Planctomycetota bacterium]
MTTLVTGATGLVGNNVVRLLLERGQSVRVLVRESSDRRPLEGLDVEIVWGDVRDAEAVVLAVQGVRSVVHAAAMVHIGWQGGELQRQINVLGARVVARTARDAGARMIHVSSVDALGQGTKEMPADEETPFQAPVPCPYPVTKHQAEQVVLEEVEKGLDAVIVNPVFMLGPWDWKPSSGRLLLAVARGRMLICPPGGGDFCDVRDVAAGIITAIEKGRVGVGYILGGEPLCYYDAWHLFAEVCGSRGPIGVGFPLTLKIGGRLGDLWGKLTGREPDVNSASVGMSLLPHHFNYARAAAELDYHPRPAREAVEAAWAWFREYGYV